VNLKDTTHQRPTRHGVSQSVILGSAKRQPVALLMGNLVRRLAAANSHRT
jgi:hypothetical protein